MALDRSLNANWHISLKEALVYLPAVIINIAYLVCVSWARSTSSAQDYFTWNVTQYMSITLSRFAPSLEMITFLQFTIRQTKQLLRRNAPSQESGSLSGSHSHGAKSGSKSALSKVGGTSVVALQGSPRPLTLAGNASGSISNALNRSDVLDTIPMVQKR
ncbi:hypothetical protein BC828DRAFT_399219 [Blastocladiella britannica]|nr:hypothetical protein BC828DRAFT_399219 [Blastocladiella britannica]